MPDFGPSSVPMGVDEEVGGTPASTIRAAWIIASSTPTRVRPCPGQCPRREGRSYTCLSNGKLERNIGECAGSGVLSHSPAERLVELEFEQPSQVIERLRTGVCVF